MNQKNFFHNEFLKNDYNCETKDYIVNINSKDRDIIKYPNPFNFKIIFNRLIDGTKWKSMSYYTDLSGKKYKTYRLYRYNLNHG